MVSIIIPASKSITITDRFPRRNINQGIMPIGNDGIYNYISYLFFDISSIPCDVFICDAELVLFKIDKFFYNFHKNFGMYTLNEYFSTYTTFLNYPKINTPLNTSFNPFTTKVAVTIPITEFVRLWLKNFNVTTNLMLYGKNKYSLVHFGSAKCTEKYLTPFIKINFKSCCNNTTPTLRKIRVTGTVAEQSKYNAVVNIDVLRKHKCVDTYYIAEEYDNSKNTAPLYVNKIYNIPIIPGITSNDKEKISFYGSYKE